MINILLNGIQKTLEKNITISKLLIIVGESNTKVAVERNGEVVPSSLHSITSLQNNDAIEIIKAVGGG